MRCNISNFWKSGIISCHLVQRFRCHRSAVDQPGKQKSIWDARSARACPLRTSRWRHSVHVLLNKKPEVLEILEVPVINDSFGIHDESTTIRKTPSIIHRQRSVDFQHFTWIFNFNFTFFRIKVHGLAGRSPTAQKHEH